MDKRKVMKQENRGGKREGAGRPKNVNTKTLQVRGVPEEIHKFCGDWVRDQIKLFKKKC